MSKKLSDEQWMRYAIRLAHKAPGEVPVGALLVKDDECIAQGWNAPIQSCDPTAHAEIIAIRQAGQVLKNYRLSCTTLYVTLEPCIMCLGAILQARIERLVFGAFDANLGAMYLAKSSFFNRKIDWSGGVLEQTCAMLLLDFFKARRKK